MIIVLAVISVMAAISYPMLRGPLTKIKLKAIANKVAQHVSETRLRAMQEGKTTRIRAEVPSTVSAVCEPIMCYPDGSVDQGVVSLQQEKLRVDIIISWLTQSAKVGEVYKIDKEKF